MLRYANDRCHRLICFRFTVAALANRIDTLALELQRVPELVLMVQESSSAIARLNTQLAALDKGIESFQAVRHSLEEQSVEVRFSRDRSPCMP